MHTSHPTTIRCENCPTVISEHTNTEQEHISIERVQTGRFKGKVILCVWDDGDKNVAPMLLDRETRVWLISQLARQDIIFGDESTQ